MNKLNSKGFSPLHILLLIVIVGMIGGVGYYVYSSQKKTNTSLDNAAKSQSDPQKSEKKVEKKEETKDETADWKFYENTKLGFSLKHPADWKVETKSDQPEWVFFTSPDYVPATELGPSVKAGYWLEVYVSNNETGETFNKDLASRKNSPFGGTYEAIKVDGNDTVLSDQKPHGSFWNVNVYMTNKSYMFRLNALDEDKPEVKELMKNILETVKLK